MDHVLIGGGLMCFFVWTMRWGKAKFSRETHRSLPRPTRPKRRAEMREEAQKVLVQLSKAAAFFFPVFFSAGDVWAHDVLD